MKEDYGEPTSLERIRAERDRIAECERSRPDGSLFPPNSIGAQVLRLSEDKLALAEALETLTGPLHYKEEELKQQCRCSRCQADIILARVSR
jgi:hypothetical protein